jgi:hypothetical protein
MLYELLAQPSRCHHAAGAVRVLAQSLTGIPDQRPGWCLSRRGTFSQAELTVSGDNPLYHPANVGAHAAWDCKRNGIRWIDRQVGFATPFTTITGKHST